VALAVAVIRKAKTLDDSAVGASAVKTSTYAAYEVLRDKASKKCLIALQHDPNPILVVYAFMALNERFPDHDLFPVLMKHLKNDADFEGISACFPYRSSVGDACFDLLADELTPEQKAQVLHQVLTTKNSLALRWWILQDWQIPPKYLGRMRKMAAAGDAQVLVALARFRREEDIPLILKGLERSPFHALRAISCFPDERFLPHLAQFQKKLLAQKFWSRTAREFYVAVAQYKNARALEILSIPLDQQRDIPMRKGHLWFVAEAIAESKVPAFVELREKLKAMGFDEREMEL